MFDVHRSDLGVDTLSDLFHISLLGFERERHVGTDIAVPKKGRILAHHPDVAVGSLHPRHVVEVDACHQVTPSTQPSSRRTSSS
jgi:hypothetical protein